MNCVSACIRRNGAREANANDLLIVSQHHHGLRGTTPIYFPLSASGNITDSLREFSTLEIRRYVDALSVTIHLLAAGEAWYLFLWNRRRPSSQAKTPTMVMMMPNTMATTVSFDTGVIVIGNSLPLWVDFYSRKLWT